jgi:hypothetical protein
MTDNTNNIHELQSIIDENKKNISDGSYLNICALTQKIMDKSKNSFYEIEYLETYVTKINSNYQIDFRPHKTFIKLSDETFTKLQKEIAEDGVVKLCFHMLSELFENLKIVKQELCCENICEDCSEMVGGEIIVKNNVLIKKIKKC